MKSSYSVILPILATLTIALGAYAEPSFSPAGPEDWPECPAGTIVDTAGSGYIPPVAGAPGANEGQAKINGMLAARGEATSEMYCDDEALLVVFTLSYIFGDCTESNNMHTCEVGCTFKWRCCKTPEPAPLSF